MRRRLRVAILLLLALGTIPVLAEDLSIRERIVTAESTPLAKAEVELLPLPSRYQEARAGWAGEVAHAEAGETAIRNRSDEEGRFHITAPGPGMWRLAVRAPGRLPLEIHLAPLLEPRRLEPVSLEKDVGARVRVVSPEGKAIAGARVALYPSAQGERARYPWTASPRLGVTDADGWVRLPRGDGEAAEVRATAPGWAPSGTLALEGAETQLVLAPGRVVSIAVKDPKGRPAPAVVATLGEEALPVALSDDAGRLELTAPASGKLQLALLSASGAATLHTLDASLPGGAEPAQRTPLALEVLAPGKLTGQVLDAASRRGLPGALVWLSSRDWTLTDARGRYHLVAKPGAYFAIKAGAPGYTLRAQRLASIPSGDLGGPTLSLEPARTLQGTVHGERFDREDPEPLAGAWIQARATVDSSPVTWETLSDDEGSFRLGGLPADRVVSLSVEAPGYLPWAGRRHPSQPAGEELPVTLSPLGGGSGQVLDPQGRGVVGAEVRLEPVPSRPHNSHFHVRAHARTDAQGRYSFKLLPGAVFRLAVQAAGYAPTEVPGLEAEPLRETDLGVLYLEPGLQVVGRVVDAEGEAVVGARLLATEDRGVAPVPGDLLQETTSDEDGSFRFVDLPNDIRLEVTALKKGFSPAEVRPLQLPLDEPLRVVLRPSARLRGRVLGPGGEAVPRARVKMGPLDRPAHESFLNPSETTDEEGRFSFESLEAGALRLTVEAANYLPHRGTLLELAPGEEREGMTLRLSRGLTLEGRVVSRRGDPIAGASVLLLPSEPRGGSHLPGAITDLAGSFRVSGLTAGRVEIRTRAAGFADDHRDGDVRLGAAPLEIVLGPGMGLSGRVVDAEARPVEGASLAWQSLLRPGNPLRTSTGPDGSFSFPELSPEAGKLSVSQSGYATLVRILEIGEEPPPPLELVLTAGIVLRGEILGLSLNEHSRLKIFAVARNEPRPFPYMAQLDPEGGYVIRDLAPGPWMVLAMLGSASWDLQESIDLPPGATEMRLDLDFGEGVALRGRLLSGEEPVAGLLLVAASPEGTSSFAITGHDGFFLFRGLPPGTVKVATMGGADSPVGEWQVVVGGRDREIVLRIEAGALSGHVVSPSGEAVPFAELSLLRSEGSPAGFVFRRFTSDSRGTFDISSVPTGAYRLEARKPGFGLGQTTLEIAAGQHLEGLEVALSHAADAAFFLHTTEGRPPTKAVATVLDSLGRVVFHGPTGISADGLVRLDSVPAGRFTLVAKSEGRGLAATSLEVPGEPPRLTLSRETHLRLKVPELAEAAGRVRAWFAGGTPLPMAGSEPLAALILAGETVIDGLAPGLALEVQVESFDGRSWRGRVTLGDGPATEMVLATAEAER